MLGVLLTTLLLSTLPRRTCFSRDEGPFSLAYNGGKIMTEPVTVSLLWYGTEWEELGPEAIRNAIKSLTSSRYNVKDSEVPTLGDWWEIIRQYTDGTNTRVTDRVDIGAECFYTGPQLNTTLDQVVNMATLAFNQSLISKSTGLNLTCTQAFEANESTIYFTMFSHAVKFSDREEEKELMDSCTGDFMIPEGEVKMGWVRAPQNEGDQCSMFLRGYDYVGPPNGDQRIDSLVGFVLAKIAEVATNGDGRGWIGSDGSEWTVSSSCGDVFEKGGNGPPLYVDRERNVSFNGVGLNGYRYIVQYIWDQSINNCALKLSETCGSSNAVMLKQPKGYLTAGLIVNHSNGLQPYPPNQKCQWKIQYPTAKFISFTFNYLSVGVEGSNDDHLMICQSDSSPSQCTTFRSNAEDFDKTFKLTGSKAYIEFISGDRVPFESRGWELSYSAGLCIGKEEVYNKEGVIGYTSSMGYSYVKGLSCQWILHGKQGTQVTLTFTHINITRDFDFLAIYNGTMWEMANFSGFYSSSDLPKLNLTGKVMISFATQTDNGEGWSANFYISSPVDQNKEKLIVLIVLILTAFLLSGVVALVTVALVWRKRKQCVKLVEMNENLMLIRAEVSGEESLIGEGPSSIVYRAISTDGISIALKSPKDLTPSQTKLEEEILLKTSLHPNIVSLVGYGEDGIWGRYLVFEYMSRGSLRRNLRENGETLEWQKRLAIAIQISSAIQTLHMYLKPPIRHGNITSENILLDEYYNAKLGGFGGASYCASYEANPDILLVMAEDIRSFGLLLVELLRGEGLGDGFEEVNTIELDQRLSVPKEEYKMGGLIKLGEIAKWCISTTGPGAETITPKIGDIVSGLKQVEQLFNSAEV